MLLHVGERLAMENSTGLSLSGFLKWAILIVSIQFVIKAYQGIVNKVSATGLGIRSGPGELVTEGAAVRYGWQSLGYAVVCWAIAWAIWFFIQRNED